MTEAQHRRLGDILDSGPVAYGLDTGIWTSPMIAWVIEEQFGVTYHSGHVRKLLHELGFSVQRPRRVLARGDRQQCAYVYLHISSRGGWACAPLTEKVTGPVTPAPVGVQVGGFGLSQESQSGLAITRGTSGDEVVAGLRAPDDDMSGHLKSAAAECLR